MNEEDRKKQIKQEIKLLVTEREQLRAKINSLKIELDYMNGHYDKTWEQKYGNRN